MTQAEIDRLHAENARLKAELAEKRKAEIADYAEGLIEKGILIPRLRAEVVELLNYADSYDNGDTVSFNEGESLTAKLKQFFENQPKVVEFAEIASPLRAYEVEHGAEFADYADDVPQEAIDLDQQIKAYMKANGVDYRTAFNMITQGAK